MQYQSVVRDVLGTPDDQLERYMICSFKIENSDIFRKQIKVYFVNTHTRVNNVHADNLKPKENNFIF